MKKMYFQNVLNVFQKCLEIACYRLCTTKTISQRKLTFFVAYGIFLLGDIMEKNVYFDVYDELLVKIFDKLIGEMV